MGVVTRQKRRVLSGGFCRSVGVSCYQPPWGSLAGVGGVAAGCCRREKFHLVCADDCCSLALSACSSPSRARFGAFCRLPRGCLMLPGPFLRSGRGESGLCWRPSRRHASVFHAFRSARFDDPSRPPETAAPWHGKPARRHARRQIWGPPTLSPRRRRTVTWHHESLDERCIFGSQHSCDKIFVCSIESVLGEGSRGVGLVFIFGRPRQRVSARPSVGTRPLFQDQSHDG